ncbi:Hypothetical_protein [Hexamita inflata]|uniref:Hypothetical_protein n=1 Tax=Hexamita inflata TaxID=28002 RepID=A0ABP1I7L6_9EUKA
MHENSPYFTLRENTSDSTRLWCSEHSTRSICIAFERYSSVYQKVLQYSIGCFRFIRAKFKLSNYAFRQVLALSSNIEAQTEFGQETRYRCQRHGNSTKGLVFFSYDSSSFESMALAILTTRKSQLSQIF